MFHCMLSNPVLCKMSGYSVKRIIGHYNQKLLYCVHTKNLEYNVLQTQGAVWLAANM